jgi:teichuronic acid biosynthesis glycosyltransferase TuaG
MEPKISVVVTSFNRPELLKETVLSILAQTFVDFELIIIDNHSEYDFFELVRSFSDDRIKAFQNINNGIIAINRNYGIRLSVGEYIAFCDDDDLWEPTKLEEQIYIMNKYPSIALTCTDISFINLNMNKPFHKQTLTYLKNKALSFNIVPAKYLLIFLPFIVNSSVLLRKSTINSIGYINEDPNLLAIEDYDYWFRAIVNEFKVYYINKKLVQYRVHYQQLSLKDIQVINRTLNVIHNYWPKLNSFQRLIYKLKKFSNY